MPRRTDIESVLVIGAGPIVIGQACEFDYSGTQACCALRQEGYRVILVNSNPATIMTDPEVADATYIEPLCPQVLARIVELERPHALLPTMGGQTALNCALELDRLGVLKRHGVRMIGASREAIAKAENRALFRQAMLRVGLAMPVSRIVSDMEQARQARDEIGYPVIARPSFTLGDSGGGVACNHEEFSELCEHGLRVSPSGEVLLEQPVLGWKEYELEVVRDCRDNCIVVCSIENVDPMGLHTGDSITVAPAQTLTDKEYQRMRDAAVAVLREIGVDTGGANVQFAVNPEDGTLLVIEMNPRVSRSSSLASKATGFPIARVAAKLAVGYTLDELANEITAGATPASFEPVIDYVVTKMPRFDFEKFPQADDRLTTQMKSVGEAMAIGRSFQESLHKALRSLETGMTGLDEQGAGGEAASPDRIRQELRIPRSRRLWYVADAFRQGMSVQQVHECARIDPWFLEQIRDLVQEERQTRDAGLEGLSPERLRLLKRKGFSDARLARLLETEEAQIRSRRHEAGLFPVYKRVDSCAAEFPTTTAYLYSCYEQECEANPGFRRKKIAILGGGPNRIGQGLEFDYCCVQAALALREEGHEAIMVNCNPETVSTDYDISDRLYFEPLTLEDVLEIGRRERPDGIIVQYGGQTPLRLARALERAGMHIVGTSPDSIDLAEDRDRFQHLIRQLGLRQPSNRAARSAEDALRHAGEIGFPLVVRPSYVLGGRAMEIVYSRQDLEEYLHTAFLQSGQFPVLLDRFLEDAIEVDVDAVADGRDVFIGGIMEHIEQAGVHSGDSACCLPAHSLGSEIQRQLADQVRRLAGALRVVGLVNVQFAVRGGDIYVLEVNPRASRTIPFVSKATGVRLARVAVRCMMGATLRDQGLSGSVSPSYFSVKEAVFPFDKLPGVDPLLGPEMKSTGEAMGVGKDFGEALYKAQQAVHKNIPRDGWAFLSVRDADKAAACRIGAELVAIGFQLCATRGTAAALRRSGLECRAVNKVQEGRPHIVDMLKNGEIAFIVNTTQGKQAIADSYAIRRTALLRGVFYMTTIAGAQAAAQAIRCGDSFRVACLQELHRTPVPRPADIDRIRQEER